MKLKLNEDGSAFVDDGKPVYVHDDGQEVPLDIDSYVRRIGNLTEEKDRHYANLTTAKDALAKFEGIEDPVVALEAMRTVQNFKDKDLVDAKDVDKLKLQLSEMFETDKKALTDAFSTEKTEFEVKAKASEAVIRRLMIGGRFASSPWFSGEKPKTILPPDMAADYFGKHFKIEGEGQEARAIGYLHGDKILSREHVGEPAEFEEAISVIINAYSQKDRILRDTDGGSGSGGNTSSGDLKAKTMKRSRFDQLSRSDQAAFCSNGGRPVD